MLVLTRKAGEEIVIQGNIRVTVVSVGPGRVRIGIVAPDDVTVDRGEIHAIKTEVVLPLPAMDPPTIAAKPPMPAAPVVPGVPAVGHNRITGQLAAAAGRGGRPFPRKPR